MIYTIKLDLDVDDENVASEEQLRDVVSEVFRSINAEVRDFRLLDVND